MTPVKLNVYVSYAPDDRKAAVELYDFLRPMRDEVNIWFKGSPARPALPMKAPALPLPWQILLPWYSPPNPQKIFEETKDKLRRENAHIYLFLTSYKSLNDNRVNDDITLAANRRVEGDWLSPDIRPVILAPSLWKEKSRLAGFKPIGPKKTLTEIKPIEEGLYEIATQLSKTIKDMQRDLDEAKFLSARAATADAPALSSGKMAEPYLGSSDKIFDFTPPAQVNLPEWLGWTIIFVLVLLVGTELRDEMPRVSVGRYENATPVNAWQPEFRREYPLMPPKDGKPFPPPE